MGMILPIEMIFLLFFAGVLTVLISNDPLKTLSAYQLSFNTIKIYKLNWAKHKKIPIQVCRNQGRKKFSIDDLLHESLEN